MRKCRLSSRVRCRRFIAAFKAIGLREAQDEIQARNKSTKTKGNHMTRIYVVTPKNETQKTRLVEATTSAQALRHVAGNQFAVEIAKTKIVADLVKSGCEVEVAQTVVAE